MRAHTPCVSRQARQSTCRSHIRPSKNTHTHTHTHTCASAFSLQRHASAQHIRSVESNHTPPATVTGVLHSACAQHIEEDMLLRCVCPHLCAQHRQKGPLPPIHHPHTPHPNNPPITARDSQCFSRVSTCRGLAKDVALAAGTPQQLLGPRSARPVRCGMV
jgi:hypothetical protein